MREVPVMDDLGIVALVGLTAVGIAVIIAIIFAFWWFSGYICTTFKWYDIDANAQIITTIVLLTVGGSGAVRK